MKKAKWYLCRGIGISGGNLKFLCDSALKVAPQSSAVRGAPAVEAIERPLRITHRHTQCGAHSQAPLSAPRINACRFAASELLRHIVDKQPGMRRRIVDSALLFGERAAVAVGRDCMPNNTTNITAIPGPAMS